MNDSSIASDERRFQAWALEAAVRIGLVVLLVLSSQAPSKGTPTVK